MEPSEHKPRLRLHHAPGHRRQRLVIPIAEPPDPQPVATIGPAQPAADTASPRSRQRAAPPIVDPADPRWVLAVRTGQVLRGDVLRPRDREELLRVGRMLGLRTFETSLVIAIVQDQARRGLGTDAAADLLRLVPLPTVQGGRQRRAWRIALWSAAILMTELLLILAVL